MVISEHARHELYRRLEDTLGPEAASTLMEHLPPVGWADVATKRDLEALEQRLTASFRAELHVEIHSAITSQTRTMIFSVIFALIGSNVTVGGLILAAARACTEPLAGLHIAASRPPRLPPAPARLSRHRRRSTMVISEHARHELYRRLQDSLGPEAATTLMEHLPPVGWAEVATKRDVEAMGRDLRNEFVAGLSSLEGRIYKEIAAQTRTMIFSVVFAVLGSNLTIAALAFAAGRRL